MRKSKIFALSIFILLLLGCQQKNTYNGPKIILDYVENGGVVTVDATKMYGDIVTEGKSTIYMLGNDECSACAKQKEKVLEPYARGNHCNIYFLDVLNMGETDLNKVQAATRGMYQFLENDTIPATYFFYEGQVAFRVGPNEDLGHYLEQYVEVAPSN